MEDQIYFLIPRNVVNTGVDLLVSNDLSLDNLDFFAQRKRVLDRESFFLTSMQYFQIREWAKKRNSELEEFLSKERGYERFDQVIDLKSDSARLYLRPEVDLLSDEVRLENSLDVNYLLELPYCCGFRFNDLNAKAGLPERFSLEYPGKIQGGYSLINTWADNKHILDGWSDFPKLLVTPMFRARNGADSLFIEPHLNVNTAMGRYGVRECYFATKDNLERFKGRTIS